MLAACRWKSTQLSCIGIPAFNQTAMYGNRQQIVISAFAFTSIMVLLLGCYAKCTVYLSEEVRR